MKNNSYWERRQAQRMFEYMELSEDAAKEISKYYRKSSMYINSKLDEIYTRYQSKFDLSEQEARRLLNMLDDSTSIDELINKLRSNLTTEERRNLLAMLEAPAYRARLLRLQELQKEIDMMMNEVYKQEKEISTNNYIDVAKESYYKSLFDIQKQTGLGFSFAVLNRDDFHSLLASRWSGINFSSRIWANTQELAKTLKEELIVSFMTGRKESDTAKIIADKHDVGNYQARRLVRTESAFVAGEMHIKAYKEAGIEKYRFVATLDLRTSKVCRELDGKVFELSKREVGKNYPPMHPWCRSTTICDIDEETLSKMERAAVDGDGNRIRVPANMTYNEWYDKYVSDESEILDEARRKIKSVASKKEVIKFDDLPKKLKDRFETNLNKSEDNVKRLIKQEYKQFDYALDLSSRRSRRNTITNVIELGQGVKDSTIAHEIFHGIDNKHKICKENDLLSLLENDFKILEKKSSNQGIIYYLLNNYPYAFEITSKGKIKLIEEYAGISDIINGLSNGNVNLGYGHRKEYWTDTKKQKEAIAQFGRIYYDNNEDVVEMLKDLFPAFDKKMMLIVRGLIK